MAAPSGGGIPLEEYRKDVPPGWAPNIPSYPLKLYLERLRLWYRLYDGLDETVGPLIAGRLQGRAQSIAVNLRLPDPHGGVDVGDAALVRLSVDQVHDPNTGQVIQQAIPSGVQKLLMELRAAFGEADQLQATKALETFFELRRGRSSLQEWAVDGLMKLDDAVQHAGLDLNNVAKTYLFFKSSGLPQKYVDDILLQLHGDLRRFDEARTLLLRMAHRSQGPATGYTAHYGDEKTIEQDYDSSWTKPWDDQRAHQDYWEVDDSSWSWSYWDDDPQWYMSRNTTRTSPSPTSMTRGMRQTATMISGRLRGMTTRRTPTPFLRFPTARTWKSSMARVKGGSMGLGCTTWGSKWHTAASCPMNAQNPSKGTKSGGSKGFGKGKSSFPRFKGFKGKFRPKGKGKGRGKKGFGKGKGKFGWYAEAADYDVFYQEANNSFAARQERQRRHAQTGLPVFEGSEPASVHTTTGPEIHEIHTPRNRAQNLVHDSPIDFTKDFVHKTFPGQTKTADQAEKADSSGKSNHLNFPAWDASSEAYHMVRGQRVCGLLVDPGASTGLIGSDTLKEMFDLGVVPEEMQHDLVFGPSQTKVTGISSVSDDTLARVTIPFFADEDTRATFSADILGQAGSTCPALLPNASLPQLRTVLLTQWCGNGDGYMVCSLNSAKVTDSDAHLVVLKLLLAESGHYILPVRKDDQQISEEEKIKILNLFRPAARSPSTLEQTPEQADEAPSSTPLNFTASADTNATVETLESNPSQADPGYHLLMASHDDD